MFSSSLGSYKGRKMMMVYVPVGTYNYKSYAPREPSFNLYVILVSKYG